MMVGFGGESRHAMVSFCMFCFLLFEITREINVDIFSFRRGRGGRGGGGKRHSRFKLTLSSCL